MSKSWAASVDDEESIEILQQKLATAMKKRDFHEGKRIAAKIKLLVGVNNRFAINISITVR